jgi:hypothetical protein
MVGVIEQAVERARSMAGEEPDDAAKRESDEQADDASEREPAAAGAPA